MGATSLEVTGIFLTSSAGGAGAGAGAGEGTGADHGEGAGVFTSVTAVFSGQCALCGCVPLCGRSARLRA